MASKSGKGTERKSTPFVPNCQLPVAWAFPEVRMLAIDLSVTARLPPVRRGSPTRSSLTAGDYATPLRVRPDETTWTDSRASTCSGCATFS